jgi:hypothetical protein
MVAMKAMSEYQELADALEQLRLSLIEAIRPIAEPLCRVIEKFIDWL